MRPVGICAALLLMVTSPGQRALGATPSDPFTIDRTGAERPATVALLPVTFRIEPSVDSDDHGGVVCPRWRAMTLVKASLDPTWQLIRSGETDGDKKVILHGIPGRTTLVVVECPGRPGYSLHGPRVWGGRDAAETIHFRRRRTVRTRLAAPAFQTVRMVLPQRYEGDRWPECHLHPRGFPECIGVPYEATGVAIGEGRAELSWGAAVPRSVTVQTVSTAAARWGRPVYVIDTASGTVDNLRVTAWRQTPPRPGTPRPRVRVVPDSWTDVHPIGPRSFWVVGLAETNGRFLEVKGEQTTTVRMNAETLVGPSAHRPLRVFLRPPVPVAGLVVDTGGAPVEGALVSLFELIPSRPPTETTFDNEIVTKRWIAETTSDPGGRFLLNGPAPGEYEFLAAHPTRGRTVAERRVDGTPITLRLRSTPRVRGRVFRDHLPLAGVAVHSVPDQLVFAQAADPVAVLAPGTLTGEDGRFELSLPGQGSGDVVIGGGGLATARRRYADANSLPDVTELGDIELPAPIRLTVRLPRGGCELVAVGPIGSLGMGRVTSTFDLRDGAYRFALPETGFWWLEAICDGESRALVPPAVRIDETSTGETVEATFALPLNATP